MVTAIYVELSKPLTFQEFEKYNVPMGWARIDILKRKIQNNPEFKQKFSTEELEEINKR